jgi:lipoyl(octanoyl) transferase
VRRTRWTYLGRVGYRPAFELQLALREALRCGEGEEHLLLLEHQPVYTLGRNARESDVLAPRALLAASGAEVVESDRGGQVTYHGPGQLVGYPILDLSPDRRDVRRYMRDLQAVLVRVLAAHGIAAAGRDGAEAGVWAQERKVASLGVHLSRWLTTHGFALNVTTDLAAFRRIVPCGLPDVEMASIASLTGARPELTEVAAQTAEAFAAVFARQLVAVDAGPLLHLAAATSGATGTPAAALAGPGG